MSEFQSIKGDTFQATQPDQAAQNLATFLATEIELLSISRTGKLQEIAYKKEILATLSPELNKAAYEQTLQEIDILRLERSVLQNEILETRREFRTALMQQFAKADEAVPGIVIEKAPKPPQSRLLDESLIQSL